MLLTQVKEKFQITLPSQLRHQVALAVGDILEARVEGNKITLTPKVVVDRALIEALEDEVNGRTIGPFKNLKTATRALRTHHV